MTNVEQTGTGTTTAALEILSRLRSVIAGADSSDLPSIIGHVEAVKAEAFARLVTPAATIEPHDAQADDRLLTADEAAAVLGQTARWVRDHQSELPRVSLPGRSLRFSAKRLAALVKRRSYE